MNASLHGVKILCTTCAPCIRALLILELINKYHDDDDDDDDTMMMIIIIKYFQEKLGNLECWCEDWKMAFNVSKCQIINFGDHESKLFGEYSLSPYIRINNLINDHHHQVLSERFGQPGVPV